MRQQRGPTVVWGNQLFIGSFSSGTMNDSEVGEALVDQLRHLRLSKAHRQLVREWDREQQNPEGDLETVHTLLEELWDAAQDYCPPWCHAGAHEGDGADFGVWVMHDAMEQAVRDGELLKVNDLAAVPKGYTGEVMVVNDHGNVSYGRCVRGRFYSNWDIV